LPVDHKSPPGTLKQTEGGFLSINGDGFAIYSPWNKVMEKIETYL